MSLTNKQVQHIAQLAKIHLDDNRIEKITGDLNNILAMVQTLEQVDCTTIEPLAHPLEDIKSVQRDDIVTEKDKRASFQTIAPQVASGFYLVPQVIE